ncbi:MAG TPA: DUF2127 domain-containing protein [Candidatus Saccharimonadales bacterium]|nr:DUF2127 domain-containing protein [Candidatus Saccharimonadales bacterium]
MNTRFDEVFRVSIILKGLDSLLEVIGGIALLLISPTSLNSWAHDIARWPLIKSHASISSHIIHGVHSLSLATTFGAIYLLAHGLIKVGLVIALLYNKLWAYPAFIAVVIIFIIYQIYSLTRHLTFGMSFLTVFDTFVVVLTWMEWQKQLALKKDIEQSDIKP